MKKIAWQIFIILLTVSGCVYYNTFFNAEQYFKNAQEMELRDNGKPTASAIQNYNDTIKKCGIVLTDYPDSKYADDALFLMARCFYYIGRNYSQAIKHFEELIEFYPKSEFVPQAKLYIARSNYQFRRKDVSFDLLQDFLKDNQFREYHPTALKLLADFHLEDNNFVDADFYLNRIIEKFTDSDVYDDAFFLKGKAQFEAQNYQASNQVFHSLLKSRVSRNMKLDARYYIARNNLLLEDWQTALRQAKALLKDEYRQSNIPKIQLIKARSLTGLQENDEAIQLFETIIADNKRTALSAEAAYFLGELYFNNLKDYENAIESYNNVKKEYNQSEFVEDAVTHSAVASQIIQFNNPDTNIPAEELVLQQFKLAEYYIEVLNLPDSALYVYDFIIDQEKNLKTKLDSLKTRLEIEAAVLDSLNILAAKASSDTIQTEEIIIDSLSQLEYSFLDSLAQRELTSADTIYDQEAIIETTLALEDSTMTEELAFNELLQQQDALVNSLQLYVERTEDDIFKYKNEFIPFAEFVKIWLYKTVYQDSIRMSESFQRLQQNYPDHKYTYASNLLIDDKEVEIATFKDKQDLAEYEAAADLIFTHPDSAEVFLAEIAADSLHSYHLKANYALGYLHHFIKSDTTLAKDYYDTVLMLDNENTFKPFITKFYLNKHFQSLDRLPKVVQLEEKEKLARKEEPDDLKEQDEEEVKSADRQAEEKAEKELEKPQETKEDLKAEEEKTISLDQKKTEKQTEEGLLEESEIQNPEEESKEQPEEVQAEEKIKAAEAAADSTGKAKENQNSKPDKKAADPEVSGEETSDQQTETNAND